MELNSHTIKKFRLDNRLTQSELGDLIGVELRTIQNYELGKVIPKTKYAIFRNLFKNYINNNNNVVNEGNIEYKKLTDVQKLSSLESYNKLLNKLNKIIKVAEEINDNSLHSIQQLRESILMRDKIQQDINHLKGLN